jgi:DNA mismatch repair protein MutL
MPIRQLDPDVAAKIAAGEVVERPASVVKELIENSIDAGAAQIRVDLQNGGLQLIRVSDNGCGIPVSELLLALSRHATSKVALIDDLEHIRTLGFRGEALASIAAVADVTLLSRHEQAEQGAQIHAVNGQLSDIGTAASPVGTTITVRNLFSSVPARLKFLKSRNTEVGHCHHMLEQYALAYPEIRFSVTSDGRALFATPGDGQLSSVLIEMYGLSVAEQMLPISSLDGHDDDPDRPVVSGYTSRPACYKSTRQHISFFVNRRWVLSRMLTTAVEEAYHSLLLTGRHPIAVVNISLDPALLDVNVHPAKTEIRFLKERRVYSAVFRAIRSALVETPHMPSWEPDHYPADVAAGRDVAAQFIAPEASTDASTSNASDEQIDLPQDNPWLTVTEEETGTRPPMLSRLWQSHVRPDGSAKDANGDVAAGRDVAAQFIAPESDVAAQFIAPDQDAEVTGAINRAATPPASAPIQSRRLPPLRVIGQLSQSYIVTEGPDGMYLIDQHAAHERIILERMVAAMQAKQPISQALLTPLQLELDPSELEAIEEHLSQLAEIGFAIEIQDNILTLQAVPNVLVKQMNARSVRDLLADLTSPQNMGVTGHGETWEEHALANVACKAAIKANYFLTVSEMREMIEQLEQTSAPYSCCHGRPTMVHFGLSALEREFGRR